MTKIKHFYVRITDIESFAITEGFDNEIGFILKSEPDVLYVATYDSYMDAFFKAKSIDDVSKDPNRQSEFINFYNVTPIYKDVIAMTPKSK